MPSFRENGSLFVCEAESESKDAKTLMRRALAGISAESQHRIGSVLALAWDQTRPALRSASAISLSAPSARGSSGERTVA